MKTNAIVRIVLFSIAIITLLGILVISMTAGLYLVDFGSSEVSHSAQVLPMASENETNISVVDADTIKNIEIDWVAGLITISPDKNATGITISETCSSSKYQMVCKSSGGTLKIEYCEDSISFPSFGITIKDTLSKDLTITVPSDWICDTLEIDAASASVEAANLTIEEFDLDGASGICTLRDCHVGELDLDTASGDIRFSGSLDILDCDGASANCEISVTNLPSRITVDTASGNLDLTLPEDCGFTCSLSSLSGRFSSDYSTTSHDGNYIYGDGSCRIDVSAMSGDVTIRKGA